MFFANYLLKDKVAKITTQHKNIKLDDTLLDSEKSKLYGFIYDMKLALSELKIATLDETYDEYNSFLTNKLDEIVDVDSMLDFTNILEQFIARFENLDYSSDIHCSSQYNAYNDNKSISIDFVRNVASHITSDRSFNIFDTSCKRGELLAAAKEVKPNALCYGLEENNGLAEAAKEHAEKIIKGKLKGSRIKNDAFDLLIANSNIFSTLDKNMQYGSIVKEERSYLHNMLKYINVGGVAIIGLPYYRLHKDVCMFIARYFDNVTMVKGFGNESRGLNMVYIVGQKSTNKEIDEKIYEYLRAGFNYNKIDDMFDIKLNDYNISNTSIEIDMFKGSVLDMEELYNIVETSGGIANLLEKQQVNKIHENTKKPLLPFNVGQIGLVLTSGCLDGVIDEGDGHYHLVKGRVSKKSEMVRETSDGIMEEKEIVSNRVEINVILPNGDFKTLA